MTNLFTKRNFLKILLLFGILISSTQSIVAAPMQQKTLNDSVRERRDEYFKGVQIIIDDQPAKIRINKPYEKLTDSDKEYYLSNVPERGKAPTVNESDFSSFTHNTTASYYLDNKQVSREEILKHKREYYACAGSKRIGEINSKYFYTHPYFEKEIKPAYDHYPFKSYSITILNKAVENIPIEENLLQKPTYQRNGRAEDTGHSVSVGGMSYGYTDEIIASRTEIMAHYPGGNDKFNDYLFANINVPDNLKQQQIVVSFVINTNGKLSDIFLSDDLDPLLASEVMRVMENSPKWIPAQKNGSPYMLGTRLYFKNKS